MGTHGETYATTTKSQGEPKPSGRHDMLPERKRTKTVEGGAAAKGRATRRPANAETNITPSGYAIKLFTFAHNGG